MLNKLGVKIYLKLEGDCGNVRRKHYNYTSTDERKEKNHYPLTLTLILLMWRIQ
jgi:hypothetical protein